MISLAIMGHGVVGSGVVEMILQTNKTGCKACNDKTKRSNR